MSCIVSLRHPPTPTELSSPLSRLQMGSRSSSSTCRTNSFPPFEGLGLPNQPGNLVQSSTSSSCKTNEKVEVQSVAEDARKWKLVVFGLSLTTLLIFVRSLYRTAVSLQSFIEHLGSTLTMLPALIAGTESRLGESTFNARRVAAPPASISLLGHQTYLPLLPFIRADLSFQESCFSTYSVRPTLFLKSFRS